ncbi:unnamed protein product [Meganyctiphanes norvegica]|uniref:Major facilitator superfamily (MFS) profile domain-containing protein n=1 Tax=Meganyctiphanes norvegica TaxID=48144 RepID=A0AAV2STE8_MEGNR
MLREITVYLLCIMVNFIEIDSLNPLSIWQSLSKENWLKKLRHDWCFGILMSPMNIPQTLGKYMENLGLKYILSSGVFIAAVTSILMGFLNMVSGSVIFIGLSFAIQIVSAFGAAAITNVNSAVANKEFPKCSGSVFASIETFLGLGNMIGPLIGGYLFELGGYTLPFVVVGGVLVLVALAVVILLPPDQHSSINEEPTTKISILQVLREPSIVLYIINLFAGCYGFGFFLGTLEYLLRPLNLMPLEVGYQFVLNSATFSLFACGWGWLCDVKSSSLTVCLAGAVLSFLSFLLIGPAPFIDLPFTLLLVMIAIILLGVGNSAQIMATFSGVNQEAIACGFPENLATYGLVGGIWNCCFSIGCFIGFATGGILLDLVGFKWASMSAVILQSIAIFFTLIYMCYKASVNNKDNVVNEETVFKNDYDLIKQYGSFTKTTRVRKHSSMKVHLEHE